MELRNDLIVPYPRPNQELHTYLLYKIFNKLRQKERNAFRCVCEDFEVAALDEYVHEKKVAVEQSKYIRIEKNNSHLLTTPQHSKVKAVSIHELQISIKDLALKFPNAEQYTLIKCKITADAKLQNCNTTEICINDSEISAKHIKQISAAFPYLREIYTTFCDLTDADVELLTELSGLTYLDLSGNTKITGKYLNEVPRLQELILEKCTNLEPHYLSDILEIRSLQRLNVIECDKAFGVHYLNESMWASAAENLQCLSIDFLAPNDTILIAIRSLIALQELKLNGKLSARQSYWDAIAQSETLCQLHIEGTAKFNEEYFRIFSQLTQIQKLRLTLYGPYVGAVELLENLSNKLIELQLDCVFEDFAGLLHLIKKCELLRCIKIFTVDKVPTDFIKAAVKILQKRSITQVPFIIYYILRKTDFETRNPMLRDVEHLLKFAQVSKITKFPYEVNEKCAIKLHRRH